MINSCKATKKINSFEYVAIPSPRDVFMRYGERLSNVGQLGTDRDTIGIPAMVSSGSTIDMMINAQHMLENDVSV